MRNWTIIAFFIVLIPLQIYCQIEEKPAYAPRKEKHRNVTDVLGQKQGLWKYYNVTHELFLEVEYSNNEKHGSMKYYYPGEKVIINPILK